MVCRPRGAAGALITMRPPRQQRAAASADCSRGPRRRRRRTGRHAAAAAASCQRGRMRPRRRLSPDVRVWVWAGVLLVLTLGLKVAIYGAPRPGIGAM
eukprot:scaffold88_cov387-Prasinococcus_capsulatus_cf.AAC.6